MIWIFLSILVWGLFHSLLASREAKKLAQRLLGNKVARFYRLAYNILACISFLPVLVLSALTPDQRLYLVPLPWSVLMVIGELLAVVALIIGLSQTDIWDFIGIRQFGTSQRSSKLTNSGLYRYVRHPLYSAGLVFIWLLPLMTVNVLAINIALTVYIIIGANFEERKLRREFGQEYLNYTANTPMFIPFLKGNKSTRRSS